MRSGATARGPARPAEAMGPSPERISALVDAEQRSLEEIHTSRELGLASCRKVIQLAGRSIRAVHRLERSKAESLAGEAETALRSAQGDLGRHEAMARATFLHDAEKEYAEARLTYQLTGGSELASASELGVGGPAWLNGLAEAASELRRHLLDRLRSGELEAAESLFGSMDAVYDALSCVDLPEAVTGGLRRRIDALRAVLERSRADLTTTLTQARLEVALRAGMGSGSPPT